jgi:hypothetical protein
MIAGFVVSGETPKNVLIRANGPTLVSFGLNGVMENPVLSLNQGADLIANNDDWGASTNAIAIGDTAVRVGAFAQNAGSKDSALVATLAPGIYSAQVTRVAGSTAGLALVEVYDAGLNPGAEHQKVINISTRAQVGTGESIMVAGFVITGNVPKKVLIRGIGPTLGSYGVNGTLVDPQLKLYAGDQMIVQNDDWSADSTAASAIIAAASKVGAFPLAAGSKDAAIVVSLAPGLYSAQVSGVNNTIGIALLEVYEVSQ